MISNNNTNNWESKMLEFTMKSKGALNIVFTSKTLLEITDIEPSCVHCTRVAGYNKNTKELTLVFKPGKFPVHLALEGKKFYISKKFVTITYSNGTREELWFNVRVEK